MRYTNNTSNIALEMDKFLTKSAQDSSIQSKFQKLMYGHQDDPEYKKVMDAISGSPSEFKYSDLKNLIDEDDVLQYTISLLKNKGSTVEGEVAQKPQTPAVDVNKKLQNMLYGHSGDPEFMKVIDAINGKKVEKFDYTKLSNMFEDKPVTDAVVKLLTNKGSTVDYPAGTIESEVAKTPAGVPTGPVAQAPTQTTGKAM